MTRTAGLEIKASLRNRTNDEHSWQGQTDCGLIGGRTRRGCTPTYGLMDELNSLPLAARRCWRGQLRVSMAASPLQMDVGQTCPSLTAGVPLISTLSRMRELEVPYIGKFEGPIYLVGKAYCRESRAVSVEEGMPPEVLQATMWQDFFGDPTQWWDCRRSKRTFQASKVPLRLSNRHNPNSMELQVAALDAGMKTTPESVCTSIEGRCSFGRVRAYEGPEIGTCRKLFENGRISDAIDALNLRVQKGCHVENNLFYRLLKRCIAHNDLAMGRRIHALSIESGYEGDAFLATHLISLYAAHGMLEEAMQVFTDVPVATVYNWTSIIFACARHGEATQAIRLYRQMLESTTILPDNRLYVAILKACATAGDLAAGKEVHAQILAVPAKADSFVQAGLVNMYAKCGSLTDARRVFDRLLERDVVTWTVLIAGYAQQGMGQEALRLYSRMQQESFTPNSDTYVCLLQACASIGAGAVDQGKELHAEIEERGLDLVLGGSLVNMYAKCGSLGDARRLFDRLPERDVLAWNALLAGYTLRGMGQEALSLYRNMQHEGLNPPNSVTYVCLLQACASLGVGALDHGKQLHAEIEGQGREDDLVLGGSLVNMYAKCGSLGDARRVFDRLRKRNVVTWNALIAGYGQQGMGPEALRLYTSMRREGLIPPDSFTYSCLLQACASIGLEALDKGKQLHAEIEEQGLEQDLVLGGSLVSMYAKCGSLRDAHRVFNRLPQRNVVTWTALIAGYAQQGMGREALSLYSRMQHEGLTRPNSVTYVCLMQACANVGVGALDHGKQLHSEIEEQGLQEELAGSLVNMYAKCGSLGDAHRLFDGLPGRDVMTWTALIAGYAQEGMGQEALSLYRSMQQEGHTAPNFVTYVCLLHACASVGVGAVDQGKQLHAEIEEQGLQGDLVLGGSLVNMYAKCGSLETARRVFDELPVRDVVTWTALIAGYAQQGMGQEALSLYSSMGQEGLSPPNSVTYICLLQACASVGAGGLDQGKHLHAEIEEKRFEQDLVLGRSLVNMYAKCGSLGDARRVFDRLPERDVVTWTALIAGYAHLGMCQEAISLYSQMQQEGSTIPDSATFVCLLQVCASVAALPLGKQLDAQIEEQGLRDDVALGAGLVNMYAKCGSMFDAQQVKWTKAVSTLKP